MQVIPRVLVGGERYAINRGNIKQKVNFVHKKENTRKKGSERAEDCRREDVIFSGCEIVWRCGSRSGRGLEKDESEYISWRRKKRTLPTVYSNPGGGKGGRGSKQGDPSKRNEGLLSCNPVNGLKEHKIELKKKAAGTLQTLTLQMEKGSWGAAGRKNRAVVIKTWVNYEESRKHWMER